MKRSETDETADHGCDLHLAAIRREHGLSRMQLARKSGLSRRRIAAFEEGTEVPTATELAAIAGACGVDADELVGPELDVAVVAGVVVGSANGEVRGQAASDALLREYLSMLLELRKASEIAPVSLRQDDLTELATALGGTPEAIKARLIELLGADTRDASEMLTFLTA